MAFQGPLAEGKPYHVHLSKASLEVRQALRRAAAVAKANPSSQIVVSLEDVKRLGISAYPGFYPPARLLKLLKKAD